MIARLYPQTQSGRTAKYMAEHIERQLAAIAELGKLPEKEKYDTSGTEASIAALGEAARQRNSSQLAVENKPVTLNNNALTRQQFFDYTRGKTP